MKLVLIQGLQHWAAPERREGWTIDGTDYLSCGEQLEVLIDDHWLSCRFELLSPLTNTQSGNAWPPTSP